MKRLCTYCGNAVHWWERKMEVVNGTIEYDHVNCLKAVLRDREKFTKMTQHDVWLVETLMKHIDMQHPGGEKLRHEAGQLKERIQRLVGR